MIEISDDEGDGGDEEAIEVFARERFIDALSRFFKILDVCIIIKIKFIIVCASY